MTEPRIENSNTNVPISKRNTTTNAIFRVVCTVNLLLETDLINKFSNKLISCIKTDKIEPRCYFNSRSVPSTNGNNRYANNTLVNTIIKVDRIIYVTYNALSTKHTLIVVLIAGTSKNNIL